MRSRADTIAISALSTIFLILLLQSTLRAHSEDTLPPDKARILEAVRTSSLQYTQNLPDFICTQITHRRSSAQINYGTSVGGFSSSSRSGGMGLPASNPALGGLNDVIEEKLTFFQQQEHYQVVSVNGVKETGLQHLQLAGAVTAGEFGSALHNLFDPRSAAIFTWDKTTSIAGRRVYVFKFHVPAKNGTVVIFRDTNRKILAPYSGRIFVDTDTLQVLRINSELELPLNFPITMSTIQVDYKPVEIAGKSYNLPSRSEVRMKDDARLYVNQIEFRDYHKFAVESTIHYEDETPPPQP